MDDAFNSFIDIFAWLLVADAVGIFVCLLVSKNAGKEPT